MEVLNPGTGTRRFESAEQLAADLLDAASSLPDRAAMGRLGKLAAELPHLDPRTIAGDDARTAFWINVYNALRLHVFNVDSPVTSVPASLSRFRSYGWRVGKDEYSLSIIHHALLRGNRRPHWTWGPLLDADDPRLAAAPALFDPRIHFALAFGAESSPSLRRTPFTAARIDAELREVEREYVLLNTRLHENPMVLEVPPMLRAYRQDFGVETKQDALEWLSKRLPDDKRLWLEDRKKEILIPWKLLVFGWAFPEQGWKK